MEEAAVRQLEQELSTTRDDLQGHIEQLKSLNEELHSSNEELQAANEELETSREELQSLNEELITVNAQLQTKIEDEEEMNNDLNNFLASTNIPTIFLDHQLRVKRFTPAMSRLITLLPGDVGRPIIDMSQAHLGPELVSDAQSVLEHLTPAKKEIGINGGWYVRNILPYRTSDNRIEGVVITYTDITERKRAEERTEHLASFPDLNPHPVIEVDASGEITFFNPASKAILENLELYKGDVKTLLPHDLDAILREWDKESESTFHREVRIGDRVLDEIVQLVPQSRAVRVYARDITERTSAEEALRESERRERERAEELAALFEAVPMPVFIAHDPECLHLTGNTLADEILRIPHGEELSLSAPAEARPHHFRAMKDGRELGLDELPAQRACRGEHVEDFEFTLAFEDGMVRHVLGYGTPLLDDRGRPRGTVAALVDITERKRIEEELKESEERYRNLFNTMDEGFSIVQMIFDADGKPSDFRFLKVNAAFEKQTGLHDAEGKLMRDLAPEHEAHWFEIYGKIALTGEPLRFTNEARALNRWYDVYAYRVDRPEDRHVAIVFHDITDRKRGEEALRKARDELELRVEERTEELRETNTALEAEIADRKKAEEALTLASAYNRKLIEASIDPLVTIDPEGRISDVNAATEQVTGYSRTDLIGSDFSNYFTEPAKARDGYRRVFDEGLVRDYPLEIRHSDGHTAPVLYNASVYRDEAGRVVGVFAAARDMTDLRQVESQLRQAQKVEALGTLSGGVAHDFNNILAAIIGFTELVTDQVLPGSREAHHLERVMEASLRGRELVRQMLTFSRKTEQEKKPLRVSSIVKETVRLLRAATPTTIAIRVNVENESSMILGDPTQIQQVLMNLCTNAAYAMREKGGNLDIGLADFSNSQPTGEPHGIKPGDYVKLTVRDTGVGMSPNIMERIFDPFFTTKKLGEGSGLGLSVVHGIVKQHDGYITVISEPGQGATFTVYFPKVSEGMETDEITDDDLPTGTERVLFVDDEEALVEMGEDILAELGYDVTSRMSSREALALFRLDPSRFDLIITDQTMPEMTGVELAKELLAIRPDLPIIMCTGFSYVVDADKANAAGIKAFAMKPLTKSEIAKTIRKVLDG